MKSQIIDVRSGSVSCNSKVLSFCIVDACELEVFIMVSIISRMEEDQIKIIDKDANNKFKWSWLFKLEKKCVKLHWQTVLGRSMCVERLSVVSFRLNKLCVPRCEHIRKTLSNKETCTRSHYQIDKLSDICKPECSIHSYIL